VDQAAYAEYIAEGAELPPAGTSSLVRSSARSRSPVGSAIRGRGGRFRATGTGWLLCRV